MAVVVGERTTTVRVSVLTQEALRKLSEELRQPMSQVLSAAVEHYRREVFWRKANEEYARLRASPEAWRDEMAERRVSEGTLADGLEPEEWSDDDVLPAESR
jgi:hypothetical protein